MVMLLDSNVYSPRDESSPSLNAFTLGELWEMEKDPMFKHLKEEVLNNPFAKITGKQWDGVLKKCQKIFNVCT